MHSFQTSDEQTEGEPCGSVDELDGLIQAGLSRRQFLHGTLNAAAQWVCLANLSPKEVTRESLLGFQSIPISKADEVVVPPGYCGWTQGWTPPKRNDRDSAR